MVGIYDNLYKHNKTKFNVLFKVLTGHYQFSSVRGGNLWRIKIWQRQPLFINFKTHRNILYKYSQTHMSLFPSVLTSYSTKVNGQIIDASDVNNLQTDVTQIENIIGVAGASSVVGTYEYFVKSPASNGGGHVQAVNKGGTGQTTYNKGDILIASSSSVLTKLVVGTEGQVLKASSSFASGAGWSPAISNINVQSFLSTGMWVKPSNAKTVYVTLVGAGGGGGGGTGNPGGGGGAGGTIVVKSFDPDLMQSSMLVTVSSITATDAKGVDTVFGNPSVLIATGGAPGLSNGNGGGASSVKAVNGIAGGGGGTGAIDSGGQTGGGGGGGGAGGTIGSNGVSGPGVGGAGGMGGVTATILGYGGNGALGHNGEGTGGARNGNPGSIYGGGGGGGSGDAYLTGSGGTGNGGIAIITTFTT